MLNGWRFGWIGLVVVLAVGCTSKAGTAIQDDGSPTADTGYIQQGTTGGDAADTFNIRNHVGGEQPAILMAPSGSATPDSSPAIQEPPVTLPQTRTAPVTRSKAPAKGGTVTSPQSGKAIPVKPGIKKPTKIPAGASAEVFPNVPQADGKDGLLVGYPGR